MHPQPQRIHLSKSDHQDCQILINAALHLETYQKPVPLPSQIFLQLLVCLFQLAQVGKVEGADRLATVLLLSLLFHASLRLEDAAQPLDFHSEHMFFSGTLLMLGFLFQDSIQLVNFGEHPGFLLLRVLRLTHG